MVLFSSISLFRIIFVCFFFFDVLSADAIHRTFWVIRCNNFAKTCLNLQICFFFECGEMEADTIEISNQPRWNQTKKPVHAKENGSILNDLSRTLQKMYAHKSISMVMSGKASSKRTNQKSLQLSYGSVEWNRVLVCWLIGFRFSKCISSPGFLLCVSTLAERRAK